MKTQTVKTLEEAEFLADRIEAYGGECEIKAQANGYDVVKYSYGDLPRLEF